MCDRLGAVAAAPVLTGTAANVLSLQLVLQPHEAVICASTAHIEVDECGAPERYLGCKLLPVATPDGKLTPELLAAASATSAMPTASRRAWSRSRSRPSSARSTRGPSCARWLRRRASTGSRCTSTARACPWPRRRSAARSPRPPGPPTWTSSASAGTKCGALFAESVVVYRAGLADALDYQRKQAMQLASKLRFVGAQYVALLEDDLWLELATTANAMARAHWRTGSRRSPASSSRSRSSTNAVFARLSPDARETLSRAYAFGLWEGGLARFMAAWDTTPGTVDAFVAAVRAAPSRRT